MTQRGRGTASPSAKTPASRAANQCRQMGTRVSSPTRRSGTRGRTRWCLSRASGQGRAGVGTSEQGGGTPGLSAAQRLGDPMRARSCAPGTGPTQEPRERNNEELVHPARPLRCPGSSRTFSEGRTCFPGRKGVCTIGLPRGRVKRPARFIQPRPAALIHTVPTGGPRPRCPAAPRGHKPPAWDPTREPQETQWG